MKSELSSKPTSRITWISLLVAPLISLLGAVGLTIPTLWPDSLLLWQAMLIGFAVSLCILMGLVGVSLLLAYLTWKPLKHSESNSKSMSKPTTSVTSLERVDRAEFSRLGLYTADGVLTYIDGKPYEIQVYGSPYGSRTVTLVPKF